MLSNLNTNMKILIGISSITILGIIYAFIKNMFKPKNKMIEGQIIEGSQHDSHSNNNSNNNHTNMDVANLLENLNNTSERTRQSAIENASAILEVVDGYSKTHASINLENILPINIRKTIIHLSSVNAITPESMNIYPHNYDMGHRKHHITPFNRVINIRLIGAQMPYVPHNIYGDINSNIITLKFDTDSVSITEGYYTIHTLINEINRQCTKVTLTFDNIAKKITITNKSGSAFYICFTTAPENAKKLFKKLGFKTIADVYLDGPHIAEFIPDLSIHYIDVIMDELPSLGGTETFDRQILKRIPLNGAPGDMIYYDMPYSDYISQQNFLPDINTDKLSNIHITLKRNDDTNYNLNGLHYDLKLEITEMISDELYSELKQIMLGRVDDAGNIIK